MITWLVTSLSTRCDYPLNVIEQQHSGTGDNVRGDKHVTMIKALAPEDLQASIGLLFESVRQKHIVAAQAQLEVLRSIAQKNDESAALVEAIGIYTDLAGKQDSDAAWATLVKTFSTTTNTTIKDVCQAALLKLGYGSDRSDAAVELYQQDETPSQYATEAWLRYYANEDELQRYQSGIHLEGVLTAAVAGAFRLELADLALALAKQLQVHFPSPNQRVLFAMATGFALNPELEKQHFWLSKSEVKLQLDALSSMIIPLLDEAGDDLRLQQLACSVAGVYQYPPSELYDALSKKSHLLNGQHSKQIAWCKLQFGDTSHLLPEDKELHAARTNPQQQREWCQEFLASNRRNLKEAGIFLDLARAEELAAWLEQEKLIADATDLEQAYIQLAGWVFYQSKLGNASQAYPLKVEQSVNQFVKSWAEKLGTLIPSGLFELAERLCAIKLPQSGLKLIAPLIPEHALWPSLGVLTYLRCLLEADQHKTFAETIGRIKDGEQCLELLNLQTMHAERTGDINQAIQLAIMMTELAPAQPYPWSLLCHLKYQHRDLPEQQGLHARVPDCVLQSPTFEAQRILFFMAMAGDIKRANERWVDWMSKQPDQHAVELIDFQLSLMAMQQQEVYEPVFAVGDCHAAVQYQQEGKLVTKLIMDDAHQGSRITLKASSDLAKLLISLEPGESATLGMATFTLLESLPPIIACFRVAMAIRQEGNDGSDVFYSFSVPAEPEQLVPYLQEKLALSPAPNEELMSNRQLPLYMRGHALSPLSALDAAIACWTDRRIRKPALPNRGEESPKQLVLDAYGIAYLVVTGYVKDLVQAGILFILPPATKNTLAAFYAEYSDEKYMRVGLTETGRLYRVTGADMRMHNAHLLEGLRLILDRAVVVQPAASDTEIEQLTLKKWLDVTVYDAMTLSAANRIPWLCIDDGFIAELHQVNGHLLANPQALLYRLVTSKPFNFEQRRHALLLYADVKLPIPLSMIDLYSLATSETTLAGFVLFKIIENHGQNVFAIDERHEILLTIIYLYLANIFRSGHHAFRAHYSPSNAYTSHVFNHGIDLYMSLTSGETAEQRLAKAARYMLKQCADDKPLLRSVFTRFERFASGRFLDFSKVCERLYAEPKQLLIK